MKTKKFIVGLSTTALLAAMLAGPASAADANFVDIEKSYAKDAIIELQSMGILEGMDATHFAPKGTLTRAQFTAIIVRALGLDETATVSSFKDVKGWAVGAVEAAAKAEIIEGIGNGMFAPNASLTRQEAATILVRALQLKGELGDGGTINFKDAEKIAEWAKPYIALAQQYGLVQGNPDGTFGPKATTTREQAATMGFNLLGAIDDLITPPVTDPGTVTPPVDTPPVVTPPVVTPPNNGGGGWYPPYTPPTTEPPTEEPPTTEPPVTEPPVTEPPVTEPPVTEPPVTEPPAEVDIIVPVIALIGEPVVNVVYGAEYVDAGVTAQDNKDGDLTAAVVTSITYGPDAAPIEAINTTVPDTYTIHYNVSDAATNAADEVTRSVIVAEEIVEPTVVSNVYITPDGAERIMLSFELDKELDLATGDVAIKFLDINGDEVSGANGNPVVKNKSWSGYLNNADGSVKYSTGTEDNDYVNVLPAGEILNTVVTSASSYAGSEWYNAIATIQIEATDRKGQKTSTSINMPGLDPAVYVITQDFSQTVTDDVYNYDMGFKINTDKIGWRSIGTVTGTVYNGSDAVASVQITTQEQLAKFVAADIEYGGPDGQLSFNFADAASIEALPMVGDYHASSYLTYLIPSTGPDFTHAELTIVTKQGVAITVRYVYN